MTEMMKQLQKIGIVPVVVLDRAEDALPLAERLMKGGLPCAEVTFRTAAAEDSIRQMVVGYLGDVPCDADIETVTAALAGYTCADVAAITNKAKALYVNRSVAGKDEPLHTAEIMEIISRVKPSVSPEDAAAYEELRRLESWT